MAMMLLMRYTMLYFFAVSSSLFLSFSAVSRCFNQRKVPAKTVFEQKKNNPKRINNPQEKNNPKTASHLGLQTDGQPGLTEGKNA